LAIEVFYSLPKIRLGLSLFFYFHGWKMFFFLRFHGI